MPQHTIPPENRSLRAELRAVEAKHPRWHAYLSDEGRCWAVTTAHFHDGSGVTVDAGTPAQLDRVIAEVEHNSHLVAAA